MTSWIGYVNVNTSNETNGEIKMETASWVIREKATGKVIAETFLKNVVGALNKNKYEAVPIGEYLGSINGKGI